MKRLLALGLAFAGLLLLFCGTALTADDETVEVLTIADSTGDWGFPSPYAHYSRGPGYVRMSLIFDTLIWKDENGFVPALAEKWEYLPDENAYVFNLRNDATWNDGEPFSAEDVVFTIDYIKDHPYQWVDTGIIDKAEVLDDSTVKITLTKPYAPFLDQVAGTLPIIPEHIYKEVSNPEEFQEQYAHDPVKTGELLKALGYTKEGDYYSKDGKPLELEMLVTSTNERAGEMIKQQLEQAGFKVNMRSVDSKTLDSLVGEWNYDLALSGHGGLGGDPNVLNKVIIGQGFNSARYDANPELNDVLKKQNAEMDPEKRKELVFEAQEINAQDMPALPLYYTNSYWASNDKVDFYYTHGGVGSGVPIAINKMALV